jgi:hypothetical protein
MIQMAIALVAVVLTAGGARALSARWYCRFA